VECWGIGILEYWNINNIGILEYWNIGILEFQLTIQHQHQSINPSIQQSWLRFFVTLPQKEPMLTAISPIDGRYAGKTKELSPYFSEWALIRYRVKVEVEYFKALCQIPLPQLQAISEEQLAQLDRIVDEFDERDGQAVKDIEKVTNHDVKAVEYFIKEKIKGSTLEKYQEFIHFGLTSQDINNTAIPLSLKDAMEKVFYPQLESVLHHLGQLAEEWKDIPMLARTHGQPASPTRLGKEIRVFVERLHLQIQQLKAVEVRAKFGGATGNMNAHYVTYPEIDWHSFAKKFVGEHLSMTRSHPTTQIEHYDNLASIFHAISRINTILIDLCRDIWTYISMDYFKQKVVKGEVGSSAMPHKVNPIDFENAEGNLGMANAIFGFLAEKLPLSRLQRDLTDSTVLRNIGVPIGHSLIAIKSIQKGLGKLLLNETILHADLNRNWAVAAEALQSILRREGYPKPYEALKDLTRGQEGITQTSLLSFIQGLNVSEKVKEEMKQITPFNYLGR
jgi:adenylosuccinate lyase